MQPAFRIGQDVGDENPLVDLQSFHGALQLEVPLAFDARPCRHEFGKPLADGVEEFADAQSLGALVGDRVVDFTGVAGAKSAPWPSASRALMSCASFLAASLRDGCAPSKRNAASAVSKYLAATALSAASDDRKSTSVARSWTAAFIGVSRKTCERLFIFWYNDVL